MKFKISFFIVINLILSFYIVPAAVSQDAGQVIQEDVEEEEQQIIEDEKDNTRRALEKELKKRMKESKSKAKTITPPQEQPAESEEQAPAKIEEKKSESQQPVTGEAVPLEAEKVPVPAKEMAKPQIAAGTVSFFFDDADIFEVAQTIFGEVLKVNYIIDPRVKGRVNFRTVTPIPISEVLPIMEIILRLNGVGFVEERGLYNIIPLDDVAKELVYAQVGKSPENVAIELFTFKNMDLKDSMVDIENALGLNIKGGMVRIMPIYRLNALIVVASTKEQLAYIGKWVEVFDDMFLTARPKIFVYPLQNSKAAHIASLLQSIFSGSPAIGTSPAAKTEPSSKATTPAPKSGVTAVVSGTGSLVSPETKVFADEITNSLIILATPSDYEFVKETIKRLDIVPRQVVIEALVAEIKLTDDLDFGLAWSIKTDIKIHGFKPFVNDFDLGSEMGQRGSVLGGDDAAKLGSGFTFYATDPEGVVRARLEALASDSKLKVLASPHIIVSDNREARIQIGDQVPIATSETNITGTTQIQRTIQYRDTGIILKVKPQVNEGGLVSLDISQEVSNFFIQKIFDSDQVVISKREAETNLVVQDNQTIIIGGLIREDTTKSREGLPFLSKIPILGYLFGSTSDKYARTELIILLTPHVVRNQQEAKDITTDYIDKFKDPGRRTKIEELIKRED
ncbi:MAG: hypothetical protein A2Y97_03515 [Nitrospirae bacterium RBG_13_39_12]|nr:MAG: hypothetical protein A2Y97_03515 [Nitrospirae bacterium RBG_13_39_12]